MVHLNRGSLTGFIAAGYYEEPLLEVLRQRLQYQTEKTAHSLSPEDKGAMLAFDEIVNAFTPQSDNEE